MNKKYNNKKKYNKKKKEKIKEKPIDINKKVEEVYKNSDRYRQLKWDEEAYSLHIKKEDEMTAEEKDSRENNLMEIDQRMLNIEVNMFLEKTFKKVVKNGPEILKDIDKKNKKIDKETDKLYTWLKNDLKTTDDGPENEEEDGLFIYKQLDEEEIKNNKSLQEVDEVFASMKRRVEK